MSRAEFGVGGKVADLWGRTRFLWGKARSKRKRLIMKMSFPSPADCTVDFHPRVNVNLESVAVFDRKSAVFAYNTSIHDDSILSLKE